MTFSEERRGWKLSGLMYVDGMALCGESEKDLRMMIERFSEGQQNLEESLGVRT